MDPSTQHRLGQISRLLPAGMADIGEAINHLAHLQGVRRLPEAERITLAAALARLRKAYLAAVQVAVDLEPILKRAQALAEDLGEGQRT